MMARVKCVQNGRGRKQWFIEREGLERYGPYDSRAVAESMKALFDLYHRQFTDRQVKVDCSIRA